MLVFDSDGGMLEHRNNINCRTRVKLDSLWECLRDEPVCCPHLINYGPSKYCIHKDHMKFEDDYDGCMG